jgi:hypothetical protein
MKAKTRSAPQRSSLTEPSPWDTNHDQCALHPPTEFITTVPSYANLHGREGFERRQRAAFDRPHQAITKELEIRRPRVTMFLGARKNDSFGSE